MVTFVQTHLSWLFNNFVLFITNRTFDAIVKIISEARDCPINVGEFQNKVVVLPPRSRGIVALTVGVIEKRIGAVIHFSTHNGM